MPKGAVLEARDLVKRFSGVAAVDGVSFEVHPGEVLTLLGPSGCGKTTTLRLIAGFERPDEGELTIRDRLVFSATRRVYVPPEKRELGMVFQSYAIWPHMTVFENVAYPLVIRRIGRQEIRRRVDEILDQVGLDGFADRSATLLSGGQQQRVALARALVYSPSLLLLDEPLSNLDTKLRAQMRIELQRLQQRINVAMLFVTHDQVEAMSLSTRVAVMNRGRIEQIGPPQEVYEHPRSEFVEEFLGRVLRFGATVLDIDGDGLLLEVEGAHGAQLRVTAAVDAPPRGSRVQVCIRPEFVHLRRYDDRPRPNVLSCAIEKVLYLGSDCELHLRVGDLLHPHLVPRTALPDLAGPVELYLPADRLRLWLAPGPATVGAHDTHRLTGSAPSADTRIRTAV